MASEVRIITGSFDYTKAFLLGNVQNPQWLIPPFQASTTGPSGNDGFVEVARGGAWVSTKFRIYPYAEGSAGLSFSMRVYAGQAINGGQGQAPSKMWFWPLLAEFLCVTCEYPGVVPQVQTPPGQLFLMTDQERFCDTITLTQGSLGPTGFINATGTQGQVMPNGNPGVATNIPGYIEIELSGARWIGFDFQRIDQVNMNCLWSPV
jgi:hypothetical protein